MITGILHPVISIVYNYFPAIDDSDVIIVNIRKINFRRILFKKRIFIRVKTANLCCSWRNIEIDSIVFIFFYRTKEKIHFVLFGFLPKRKFSFACAPCGNAVFEVNFNRVIRGDENASRTSACEPNSARGVFRAISLAGKLQFSFGSIVKIFGKLFDELFARML